MGWPLLATAVLWPLSRWSQAQAAIGGGLAWLLAFWLWRLDVPTAGAVWDIGGYSLHLTPGLQSLFILLFIALGVLHLLTIPFPATHHFVPISMGLMMPAAAMLMARPFLLAIPFWLLLVMGALLLFDYQGAAGREAVQAAQRYWLLMLVAATLLFVAIWMLAGTQTALLLPGSRLFVLAVGIMLAGFPFFIWVRPVATAVPLLVWPLLFALFPLLLLVWTWQLVLAYPALAQTDAFLVWLPWSAALTIFVAGLLTLSSQGNWRQVAASILLLDMGFGLLAFSLMAVGGWETAVMVHGFRFVSLLLLVAGLGTSNKAKSYTKSGSGGVDAVSAYPWAKWLILLGCASLLGLPLTPGFAGRWAVLVALGQLQIATLSFSFLLLGGMGLAFWGLVRHSLRSLTEAGDSSAGKPGAIHQWATIFLLVLGLVVAALPQIIVSPLTQLVLRLSA